MASFLTASLVWTLLVFSFSVSADQRNFTAEPGDNVILTCREAENKDFEAAKWMKTNQSLCVYQIISFGEDKPVCSNSRADLLDVKKGNVSLVLKNVTTDDTGTYECRIKETTNNRRKRSIHDYKSICTVKLEVGPAKQCEGAGKKDVNTSRKRRSFQDTDSNCNPNLSVKPGNQDGGNKGGQKKDGGNEDRSKEDGGSKTGLIVGLLVCAVVVLLVPAVLYKRSRYSSLKSKCPPAVAAAVIGDTTLKELVEKNPKY